MDNSLKTEEQLFSELENIQLKIKHYIKQTVKKHFFEPFSISFDKEIQVSPFDIKKQKIKDKIRPYLPQKVKLHFLEKNDWMAYFPITKILFDDLKQKRFLIILKRMYITQLSLNGT